MSGIDPMTKKQLEIPKIGSWILFTVVTSALPIIVRFVITLLASQPFTITDIRSELFFLVVVFLVDTIKNCRHQPMWVVGMAFVLIICSIIYGMALTDSLDLLTTGLCTKFNTLMIAMVVVSVSLDGLTTWLHRD